MTAPSYHDVHITTATLERTALFDLPFAIHLTCTRTAGWELWSTMIGLTGLMAAEYPEDASHGMILDVAGHVIVDSLSPAEAK